ncbi:MAG: DUF4127 family protein [Blastocatellia bacterium]|nr:DUF4127 family protein [Blastocatellia bacterium]
MNRIFEDFTEETERRRASVYSGKFRFSCLFFLVGLLLLPTAAQRRPLLRSSARDQFAGRFLLIPRDGRPQSYQQPKMLAEVADHDLRTPPFRSLGVPAEIVAWAKTFECADLDGAIVSMEAIATEPDLVRAIRAQRSGMPIYGYLTGSLNEPLLRKCLDLLADGALDYLLLAGAGESGARALPEVAARKLTGSVVLDDGAESAVQLLLTRMLNRRFGFSPRFAPVYSSAQALNPADANRRIAAKAAILNGAELPKSSDPSVTIDGFLFVHTSQTSEAQRQTFIEKIVQALDKGARVALTDLSEENASRESLIAELRRRKLLDKLFTYSAADPAAESTMSASGDAINRALTQVATLSTGIKFLRDDLPRLRRIDRAQFTLLFNRYLTDWAYALRVRPALDAFVRGDLQGSPERLGDNLDRAAAFADERIRPLAEEVFNEQFRRNLHALLLSTGERVIFEVGLLQRLQVRFASPRTADLEVLQSFHVPQITFPQPPASEARAEWTLVTEKLDPRVAGRVDATSWETFKSDAESVDLSININARLQDLSREAYRITSTHRRRDRRIEIAASTEQGAYYGLSRLEELAADGRLTEDFQLAESPSFPRRGMIDRFDGPSWSHHDRLELIRYLGRVRMNRYYYAPKADPLRAERWREDYSEAGLQRLAQLAQTADRHFVDLVYSIEPGGAISHSAEEDWQALSRKLDALAAIGIRHFMLLLDDRGALPERDRARFKTLAEAQAHLVSRVHDRLASRVRGFELSVAPVNSFRDLKAFSAAIPSGVLLLWTGAEGGVREFTRAQTDEWRAIAGRNPVLWDSFPGNQLKPWRLFLGPKRSAAPDLFSDAAGFIATPMGQFRASMLPIATSAQYAWDAKGYNPANALNTALDLLYDDRARPRVRVWEQVYGGSWNEPNLFDPLHETPAEEINLTPIEQRLAELQSALESIGASRDQGLLRGELAAILERNRAAVERVKNSPAYERLTNGNYRLRR